MSLPGKVKSGDELLYPASFFNAQIDATKWVQQRRNTGTKREDLPPPDRLTAWIKNDSGGDVGRFGILTVSDYMFSASNPGELLPAQIDHWALVGSSPVADGRPVLLLEPIKAGEIGRCLVAGVCPVTVQGDASLRFADIIDDEAGFLKSSTRGPFEILKNDDQDIGNANNSNVVVVRFPVCPPDSIIAVNSQTVTLANTWSTVPYTAGNNPAWFSSGTAIAPGRYRFSVNVDYKFTDGAGEDQTITLSNGATFDVRGFKGVEVQTQLKFIDSGSSTVGQIAANESWPAFMGIFDGYGGGIAREPGHHSGSFVDEFVSDVPFELQVQSQRVDVDQFDGVAIVQTMTMEVSKLW